MNNLIYQLFFSADGVGHTEDEQEKFKLNLLKLVPELLSKMDTETPYEEKELWSHFHGSCKIAATYEDAKKIGLNWISHGRKLGATEMKVWLGVQAPKIVEVTTLLKKDAFGEYDKKLKELFSGFVIEHSQVGNIAKYKTKIFTNSTNLAIANDIMGGWIKEFEHSPLRRNSFAFAIRVMPEEQRIVWNTSLSAVCAEELQNKLIDVSGASAKELSQARVKSRL